MFARADDLVALDRRWREINGEFEQNDRTGPATGPLWRIDVRRAPVVVTAVHGVRHSRTGTDNKANDANTGGLALLLGSVAKVSAGVITRSSSDPDANAVTPHPFKDALASRLRLGAGEVLIDLHGMADHESVDVALGLGPTPNEASRAVAQQLADAFTRRGARVDLGGAVTGLEARGAGTMTAWSQSLGAAGVQVELAKRLRSFRSPASARQLTLEALLEAVRSQARR